MKLLLACSCIVQKISARSSSEGIWIFQFFPDFQFVYLGNVFEVFQDKFRVYKTNGCDDDDLKSRHCIAL